jgi:hypothetical protein
MTNQADIEAKFWKALKSDMTMFLGLDGVEDGHARPMTAQIEEAHIWLNEHSLFAGIKMLLGVDPKKDYEDKVAVVAL